MLNKAIRITAKAHDEQMDKGGNPFMMKHEVTGI